MGSLPLPSTRPGCTHTPGAPADPAPFAPSFDDLLRRAHDGFSNSYMTDGEGCGSPAWRDVKGVDPDSSERYDTNRYSLWLSSIPTPRSPTWRWSTPWHSSPGASLPCSASCSPSRPSSTA